MCLNWVLIKENWLGVPEGVYSVDFVWAQDGRGGMKGVGQAPSKERILIIAWHIQGSGRGLELPEYVMWKGGSAAQEKVTQTRSRSNQGRSCKLCLEVWTWPWGHWTASRGEWHDQMCMAGCFSKTFLFCCKKNLFSMQKNLENRRKKSLIISLPIYNSMCLSENNNREWELTRTEYPIHARCFISFTVIPRFTAPGGPQPEGGKEGQEGRNCRDHVLPGNLREHLY